MSEKSPLKKLVFVPNQAMGHLTLSICIVKSLQKLYQNRFEFYFVVNEKYRQILSKKIDGIKFKVIDIASSDGTDRGDSKLVSYCQEMSSRFGETWKERDIIKFNLNGGHPYRGFMSDLRSVYPHVTKAIQEIEADLIFIDEKMTSPVAIDQGIKYVLLLSCNPALFGDSSLPPPRSLLSGDYTEENKKLWTEFIEKAISHEDYLKFMKEANDWLIETNSPVRLDGKYIAYCPSPYLNVYNYPRELSYAKMEGNWIGMDSAVIDLPSNTFEVPEKLKNCEGELIYFSLGSMSSTYKPLMNRLLSIFSQIPHRFIISKGPIGDEYELADNQYGENYLDQLSILQTVACFITHGGNNSVTESIHLGCPMIILPLFGDQYNNAKRIDEKNCGVRLDPFLSTKEEFEEAIKFCLQENVKEKLKIMSDRIKKDNNLKSVCEAIVNLIET